MGTPSGGAAGGRADKDCNEFVLYLKDKGLDAAIAAQFSEKMGMRLAEHLRFVQAEDLEHDDFSFLRRWQKKMLLELIKELAIQKAVEAPGGGSGLAPPSAVLQEEQDGHASDRLNLVPRKATAMQDGGRSELEERHTDIRLGVAVVSAAEKERAQQTAACAAREEQSKKSLCTTTFDEDFTTGIGSEGMLHVRKLSISSSSIQRLPEAIYFLTNLQELGIEHCRDRDMFTSNGQEVCRVRGLTLPSNFGTLKRLQTLTLTGVNLNELPESFGQLTSLTYLAFLNSNLDGLPPSFG